MLRKLKRTTFNPCRVVDPRSDGHAVLLFPCQELEIKVTKSLPGVRITCESPYLTLKSHKCNVDKDLSDLYTFEQLYDLTDWCELSAVVLGNILVEDNKGNTIRLLLQCRKSSINTVITVLNPTGEHVKIEPNQILEIVSQTPCTDSVNNDQYSFMHGRKNDLVEDGSTLLEKLREETIFLGDDPTRKGELFNAFDRSLSRLPSNPKLSPVGKVALDLIKEKEKKTGLIGMQQKHFWYRLHPAACEKIIMTPDVTYICPQPLAGIVVSDGKGKLNNLTLFLCQRSLAKIGLPMPPAKDEVLLAAKNQGIKDKFYSPMRNLLVNPSSKEHHELVKTDVGLYIEVASPSEMFSVVDPKCKWELHIEPIQSQRDGSLVPRLKSVALPKKYINGKEIQRFLIIRNMLVDQHGYKCSNGGRLLGIVSLHCQNLKILGDRLIHVWDVTNKSSIVDEYDGGDYVVKRSHTSTPTTADSSTRTPFKVLPPTNLPMTREYPVAAAPKTVIKVSIKEDCTPLTEGITEIYVYDSIIHKVFDEDRKKTKWGGGHEHYNYQGERESKKKETNTPLLVGGGGRSVAKSISQSPSYLKQTSRVGSQTLPGSKEGKVIITDPSDGDFVRLQFNQELVIRVPLVDWGIIQDIQYCWTATPYHTGNSKFFVKSQRLIIMEESAKTRHYQEFVFAFTTDFLKQKATAIDKHLAGGIRFENTSSYLNIIVFLDVIRPLDEDEIVKSNQQLDKLRELMKYVKIAKEKMKAEEEEKAAKLAELVTNGLLKPSVVVSDLPSPSSGRAICVMEPIGEAITHVNEADRIKVMLNKVGGSTEAEFALKKIPAWLDQTGRRQNDKHDIFEFETNPKVNTVGRSDASLVFISLLSNASKEVRLRLSSKYSLQIV